MLRVGSTTDIDSLNPFTADSTQSDDVLQLVYDKLMTYDAQLNIVPSLATNVQKTDGDRTFTYTLRSGVTWHDGKDFTADDVVFTFLMVRDNDYGTYGAYLKNLVDVTKVSGTQVRLTYSEPQVLEPGIIIPIAPQTCVGGRFQRRPAEVRQRKAGRYRTVHLRVMEQGQRGHGCPQRRLVGGSQTRG